MSARSCWTQTGYTQPALFAIEVALFRLITGWGVRPHVLAGHSIGEVAAAHVAGVLSLPDACRLVAARGQLMQALPAGGAMLAVQTSVETLPTLLDGLDDQVSVAAVNGPTAVVVSGLEQAIDQVADRAGAARLRVRRLRVSHAFHSALMDPMLTAFETVAAGLSFHAPQIPIVSTLTGRHATVEELTDPGYWVRHVRHTVRFHDAIGTLRASGVDTFLELGPDAVLTAMTQHCLDQPEPTESSESAEPDPSLCVAVLRADAAEPDTLVAALARLHATGQQVDWAAYHGVDPAGVHLELPTYAFQHQRFWLEATQNPGDADQSGPAGGGASVVGGGQ